MHAQGINGQRLADFLEKLASDGFAGASRAHTQVTKALWSARDKDLARKAIAEHYGASSVRPPPPMPVAKAPVGRPASTSQWARSFVDAKPKTPAKPAPKAPTKPAPKTPAKPAPAKKKTRAMTPEERAEKHRTYNREYARRRKAERLAAERAAAALVEPKDLPTPEELGVLQKEFLDALGGPSPFSVERKDESVPATIAAMAHATRHELANLAMRVAILEETPAGKRATTDPLESVRVLQGAMLAVADASKVDPALMPELHRIGRSVARLCVHIVEAMAGPEHPPTRGRGRPKLVLHGDPPPTPEETAPAEETVSLPFDIDEGPESVAAE